MRGTGLDILGKKGRKKRRTAGVSIRGGGEPSTISGKRRSFTGYSSRRVEKLGMGKRLYQLPEFLGGEKRVTQSPREMRTCN